MPVPTTRTPLLPQTLHIFRKDILHLWPETLVGIVLLAAFAWATPYKWGGNPYAGYVALLDGLLHVLIPVAWLVMISRLIQDEPLVGDRQFWTSRPYHWAKLLLAKILFLLVFLYLPFLLMQVYLLKHAGLHPASAVPQLLHNLLLLTVILIVPIAAIAAVTSTFARVLLSVLGALIYVLVVVGVAGFLAFDHMPPPHLNGIAIAILILLPAIALVFQYSTRRTNIARLMLLSCPLIAVALLFLTPAMTLIRHGYQTASDAPKLSPFAIPSDPAAFTGKPRILRNRVEVALPVKVDGADKDSNYLVQGTAVTLDAPGVHWTSPYLSTPFGNEQINSSPFTMLAVSLPVDVFNKIHASPVDLHLSLATEHLKAQPTTTWKATQEPFDIPGHGHCAFSTDDPDQQPTCRFPLQTPKLLFLNAPVASECPSPTGRTILGRQMLGGQPSTLDFDPVVIVPINLQAGGGQRFQGKLCPDTPLSFVQADSVGNTRIEFDDKQILLDPLVARFPADAPKGANPAPAPQ